MKNNNKIYLYNTLSHRIEEFSSVTPGVVSLYNCGPTIWRVHTQIGNLRSYTFSDMLKRFFRFCGYEVRHAIKITDVDDHIVVACREEGLSIKAYIDSNFDDFLRQIDILNLQRPDYLPRVTENIDDIVNAIKKLNEIGYVYYANGSAYFDIGRVKDYGILASMEKQMSLKKNAQGRLSSFLFEEKKNENDFCLWKAWNKSDGDIFWETDIGRGRPGWHIGCSVLSRKYLGEQIDIHIGGISHIFPHHTNEIAISEALTPGRFVNYWLHHDYLIVDGVAMSKEKGTFYVLQDILNRGYHPLVLRFVLMKTHYRQALNFTWQSMDEAKISIVKLLSFYHLLHQENLFKHDELSPGVVAKANDCESEFIRAFSNDLNFSDALASVFCLINEINRFAFDLSKKDIEYCRKLIFRFDQVFGFISELYQVYLKKIESVMSEHDIYLALNERQRAKNESNFNLADKIRIELTDRGLRLLDIKGHGSYCELNDFWD